MYRLYPLSCFRVRLGREIKASDLIGVEMKLPNGVMGCKKASPVRTFSSGPCGVPRLAGLCLN